MDTLREAGLTAKTTAGDDGAPREAQGGGGAKTYDELFLGRA